jgi:hypothetical protein
VGEEVQQRVAERDEVRAARRDVDRLARRHQPVDEPDGLRQRRGVGRRHAHDAGAGEV